MIYCLESIPVLQFNCFKELSQHLIVLFSFHVRLQLIMEDQALMILYFPKLLISLMEMQKVLSYFQVQALLDAHFGLSLIFLVINSFQILLNPSFLMIQNYYKLVNNLNSNLLDCSVCVKFMIKTVSKYLIFLLFRLNSIHLLNLSFSAFESNFL